MIPVALVEAVETGLLYFRRFMSIYNKAAQAVDIGSNITSFFDNDLRYHRRVEGEEIYLFILGRDSVAPILIKHGLERDEANEAVILAILASLEYRGSNDIRNTIITFAYHLGQICQTIDDDFASAVGKEIDAYSFGAVSQDPVMQFLELHKGAYPAEIKNYLYGMGMESNLLPALYESLSQKGIVKEWIDMVDNNPLKGSKIHKGQTFLGQVWRGARSMVSDSPIALPVMSGPDALFLETVGLSNNEPLLSVREPLTDIRSITREMIAMASNREMLRRGYVRTSDKEWALRSDVTLDYLDPDKPAGEKVFKLKDTSKPLDLVDMAKSEVTGRIKSVVKGHLTGKLMQSGKRVFTTKTTASESSPIKSNDDE